MHMPRNEGNTPGDNGVRMLYAWHRPGPKFPVLEPLTWDTIPWLSVALYDRISTTSWAKIMSSCPTIVRSSDDDR